MPMLGTEALAKIRSGALTVGFGVHHLRGAAPPLIARAAGFDWLFIDAEHGAITTDEIAQICLASLTTGVAPLVRIAMGALHEGTRALDNGALGIIVPHVDTAAQAKAMVDAFRYHPLGRRSWGGPPAQFGYRAPAPPEAQAELNRHLLAIAMIETPQAVENAAAIAAVDGIDGLLIGTSDLSLEMGISGQIGHQRIQRAYEAVAQACRAHGKVLGMGGVYDERWAEHYIGLGVRFVLAGNDHGLLLDAATKRATFLRDLAPASAEAGRGQPPVPAALTERLVGRCRGGSSS